MYKKKHHSLIFTTTTSNLCNVALQPTTLQRRTE